MQPRRRPILRKDNDRHNNNHNHKDPPPAIVVSFVDSIPNANTDTTENTTMKNYISIGDYSKEEIQNCWYSKAELASLKQQIIQERRERLQELLVVAAKNKEGKVVEEMGSSPRLAAMYKRLEKFQEKQEAWIMGGGDNPRIVKVKPFQNNNRQGHDGMSLPPPPPPLPPNQEPKSPGDKRLAAMYKRFKKFQLPKRNSVESSPPPKSQQERHSIKTPSSDHSSKEPGTTNSKRLEAMYKRLEKSKSTEFSPTTTFQERKLVGEKEEKYILKEPTYVTGLTDKGSQ